MSLYSDAYKQLNQAQKQAVHHIDGPVMVVAGPGSGKTQLLSLRIAHILESREINPENILCLTFTDSAAYNMRKRLASFMGTVAYQVHIHTFHSFGQSILQNYPEYSQYINRTAIDAIEQNEIIEHIFGNLPYNHILRPRGEDMGQVIKDIIQAISYLKQAGITPDEYDVILSQNIQDYEVCNPYIQQLCSLSLRSKKNPDQIIHSAQVIVDSLKQTISDSHRGYFGGYISTLVNSLNETLYTCQQLDSLKPLSQWKTKYTVGNHQKVKVLKDSLRVDKQQGIAEIYRLYREYCDTYGLMDFHDMLIDSITLLKNEPILQQSLQDQYQYILVDEFQDTNEAQMRLILSLIGDNPEPNILVVGDDDQAVYGFQGADVSHMLSFQKRFPSAELIVLLHNYRSTQSILDIARQVIIQGKDRLENRIESLEKKLESAKLRQDGDLAYYEFETQTQEYAWIAHKVEELRAAQEDISEIAIIARQHKHLQALIPYLMKYDIPVDYDQQYDLLQETIIHQIVTLLEYIESLGRPYTAKDYLLAEILAYPFWGISRLDIWKFFQEHTSSQISYLERLQQSSHPQMQYISKLCLDLSLASLYEPMETIVLAVIGIGDDVYMMNTPFHQYYFDIQTTDNISSEYIDNIRKVQAFIDIISRYKSHQKVLLTEGLAHILTYARQGGLRGAHITKTGKHAVKLITAHKVKGLEFNTVFVIEAHTQSWMSMGKSFRYPFPLNMPIVPKQDSDDDFLRLLFVALTRSKQNMFITTHTIDQSNKEKAPLPYLDFLDRKIPPSIQSIPELDQWEATTQQTYHLSEISLLEGILETYRLSASHVNMFVDTMYGGPHTLLNNVLLKFPQKKTLSLGFGNVLHKLFHAISTEVQLQKSFPSFDQIMQYVTTYTLGERLNQTYTETIIQKCEDILPHLLEAKKSEFYMTHISEYNVKSLNLEYEGVPLTGSIDRIEQSDDYYTIVDFKTSTPIISWNNKDKQDVLNKYKRQLYFYGLLLQLTGQFQDKPLMGRIDFLEPTPEGEYISLSIPIEKSDIEYIQKLTQVIYHKISNLDFSDVSEYVTNGGTLQFIEDLLAYTI
jgi:DNA helicase-2/ATP-dependent DNA helicase PcrA